MKQDPKELSGFRSMDDAPTNKTGRGQDESDWEPPTGKLRKLYEDDEGEEDPEDMRDIWDDFAPNED